MSERANELKGSAFTMSVLYLITADCAQIKLDLQRKVKQAPHFFEYAPLVVNIQHLKTPPDLNELKKIIIETGFLPVGISGYRPEQRDAIHQAGLCTLTNGRPFPSIEASLIPTPETHIHRGLVRSGQQIYAKDSNLVVLGSVSAGAEVIADGSIHVYGKLRGRAIAGASGKADSQIYCEQLEAELISINGHYQLSETTLQSEWWRKDVSIMLQDGRIQIEKLKQSLRNSHV